MITQFVRRKHQQNAAGECPVQLLVYSDKARLGLGRQPRGLVA